jgi:spore germination protein KA
MSVGKTSTIPIALIYMGSIIDTELLNAVKKKIESIECDNLINIGEFEERLLDKRFPFSIFPQVIITERPDKFCSNIMEGKIGILIDGLPTAIILPAVLNMYFHSSDDYSNNYSIATFGRVLRYLCTIIALVLPAVYIAIVCYHQELLNNAIALSIIKSKQEVPLSSFQEILFLTLAFEVLLEAGIRLPKTIGQTVPIIGGLIIGDAAVSAKILSPIVVIVAAITGIAGFMIPNQDFLNSIRLCRYIFIVFATLAGFFGLAVAAIGFLYYLCSIESFNVPYFVPFASNDGKALLADTLYRPSLQLKQNKKQ